MQKKEFEAERRYQADLSAAKSMLHSGIITQTEFNQIDAFLLNKYKPLLGRLFSDNA